MAIFYFVKELLTFAGHSKLDFNGKLGSVSCEKLQSPTGVHA